MPVEALEQIDPRDLGARLREARTAGSWTQEQAAETIGAARTTMVAIEKGERRVKPEELVELARLYGRKLSWFLRRGAPVEDLSVQLRGALPPETPVSANLMSFIHDLERLCDDYAELERLCGAATAHQPPPKYSIDGGDVAAVAEDVANAERNRLGLGDAPVLNLRAVLEDNVGLRVFYLDLPSKVAGMFAFTDAHGGVLGINRKHPPERRRHSMAHEFGHFLTDRYRSEITFLGRYERRPAAERFAETFGRAFLMPAASIRRRFHELVRQRRRGSETDRADRPALPPRLLQRSTKFPAKTRMNLPTNRTKKR
jgi:DNA-binding XRE family transcriptional regulator